MEVLVHLVKVMLVVILPANTMVLAAEVLAVLVLMAVEIKMVVLV